MGVSPLGAPSTLGGYKSMLGDGMVVDLEGLEGKGFKSRSAWLATAEASLG